MSNTSRSLATRLRIYLVADFSTRDNDRVLTVVSESLAAGVSAVQYRNKNDLPRWRHVELAARLRELCRREAALFIVNDQVDLALEVEADGVHLGPTDMGPAEARRVAGDKLIIGGSTGTAEGARELVAGGCDYLGVGAIFDARRSKADASAPRGPEAVLAVKRAIEIPVVGIGGINSENAADVFGAGADGVAVIRALLDAPDPDAVTRKLIEASLSRR